jgi:chromosome segregation ATPase
VRIICFDLNSCVCIDDDGGDEIDGGGGDVVVDEVVVVHHGLSQVEKRTRNDDDAVVLVQEEVDRLKLQLGECTDMVQKLQDDLQSCSWPLTDAVAHAACNNDNNEEEKLTSQMQSSSTQTLTIPSEAEEAAAAESNHQIETLQKQLQNSIQESKSYLDTILDYKETISSLSMEVTRSQMYNEEIVNMLHDLREEYDVLKIRFWIIKRKKGWRWRRKKKKLLLKVMTIMTTCC